jgi:UDP-N-acetylglucosamine transferase subunit ALG13
VIFVTVGTQLPFDRLTRAVDDWAALNPQVEVFAQIGPAKYTPQHCESTAFLSPADVAKYFSRAELVVGHAGMGTVLASLTVRVPIIAMPRRQAMSEHRSDHQLTTARWLREELGLNVVIDVAELPGLLDHRHELKPGREIGNFAKPHLLDILRQFVESEDDEPSAMYGIAAWTSGMRKMLQSRPARASRKPPPETY